MGIQQATQQIRNTLKIAWLKYRLAGAMDEIHALYDRYSCGGTLIDHITGGRLRAVQSRANTLLDSLAKIDPTTPDVRYDILDKKEGAVEL